MEILLATLIASWSKGVPFTALSASLKRVFEFIPPIAVTRTQKIQATFRDYIPLIDHSIYGYPFKTSESSLGSFTTIIFITDM